MLLVISNHLNEKLLNLSLDLFKDFLSFFDGNTFQNFKVSSAEVVAIFSPSGDIAKWRTLDLCPSNYPVFYLFGLYTTT